MLIDSIWSALNTYKQHLMDLAGCIYICICIYDNDNKNRSLAWEGVGKVEVVVEREKGRNDINTVFMHEI